LKKSIVEKETKKTSLGNNQKIIQETNIRPNIDFENLFIATSQEIYKNLSGRK